jgi:hypothetical protein
VRVNNKEKKNMWERTHAALDEYFENQAAREIFLASAETETQFDQWRELEEEALSLVQDAFYEDTKHINSWNKSRLSLEEIMEISKYRRA